MIKIFSDLALFNFILNTYAGEGPQMKITMIVGGGGDTYYELGLTHGLINNGIFVDLIGSDSMKGYQIVENKNVKFLNLRGDQNPNVSVVNKIFRVLKYYLRLLKYSFLADTKIFHIQWIGKFVYFERILLTLYYKILGKKLVFTAHNINARQRDENDNFLNIISLKYLYKVVDRIIVHTDKMKVQLIEEYNISKDKIDVVQYGINNMAKNTDLTNSKARKILGIDNETKLILFFGIITPYKGLEYLIYSLNILKKQFTNINLIIAGKVDVSCKNYWDNVQELIRENNLQDYITIKNEFIPDEDIEIYFKAADALILPYKYIYQSGILFLGLTFGIPIIATNVGSLNEFIDMEETGFLCQPQNADDLAEKIISYFHSDLYKNLEVNREKIMQYANEKYSWGKIGKMTTSVYKSII